MSLTLRNIKGSSLTYTELDNNFTYLAALGTGGTAELNVVLGIGNETLGNDLIISSGDTLVIEAGASISGLSDFCVDGLSTAAISGCSGDAVSIDSNIQSTTSIASGTTSFAYGNSNTATNTNAFVGGGQFGNATGTNSGILGGSANVASGARSIVLGGDSNTAANTNSISAGGSANKANGSRSGTLAGGNNIVNANYGSVIGGFGNTLDSSATNSTILGGTGISGNTANTVYTPNINLNTGFGIQYGTGPIQVQKELQIVDWDMDTDTTFTLAHGLTPTQSKTIRRISIIVRDDVDTNYFDTSYPFADAQVTLGVVSFNTTNITIQRRVGGSFDSTDFDSTGGYVRGWVTILYTP